MSGLGTEVAASSAVMTRLYGQSSRDGLRGFTLIELMITVAVLTVTLTLAAPAFTDLIRDNRLISNVYSVRATLNLARSEAIARRMPVVVCGTVNGLVCNKDTDWSSGYLALMGVNEDAAVDAANPGQSRLHWENRTNPSVTLTYSRNVLVYDGMGSALGSAGTFVFCDDRGVSKARGLILSNAGSLSASIDSDDNGVVEDGAGNDVSC